MKRISFIRMIEWGTSILITVNVHAQSINGSETPLEKRTVTTSITAPASEESDKTALARIKSHNVGAYNHFTRSFANASGIFVTQSRGNMFIYCNTKDVRNRVLYNKKGKWQNTVRYYELVHLDAELHRRLRYAFPDFTPFGTVTEVQAGNQTAYLVTIEDCSSWKRIRM